MNDPIQIETGIPIPPKRGNALGRGGKWANVLREMKEGDSIVVPKFKMPTIYAWCKRNGCRVTIRRIEGTDDTRVWKCSQP